MRKAAEFQQRNIKLRLFYSKKYSFIDIKGIKKIVNETKIPSRQELVDNAKENFNRFIQLKNDFIHFLQLRPVITEFSTQFQENQHLKTYIPLKDHQRYYFLKADLMKFIPLSFIIALPMTCFIMPYYILKFPHKIPSQFQFELLIKKFLDQKQKDHLASKQFCQNNNKFPLSSFSLEQSTLQELVHLVQYLQLDVKLKYSETSLKLRKLLSQNTNLSQLEMKKQLIVAEIKEELMILKEQDHLVNNNYKSYEQISLQKYLQQRGIQNNKSSPNQINYLMKISQHSENEEKQIQQYLQVLKLSI